MPIYVRNQRVSQKNHTKSLKKVSPWCTLCDQGKSGIFHMPAKKTKVSSVQTLKEIIQILRKNRADLDRLKVKHLMVFGSFARNEQTSASDVDLLVEFSVPVGYFHFYDLRVFLERVLKRKVDLTTLDALKPAYRNEILKDSIRAS